MDGSSGGSVVGGSESSSEVGLVSSEGVAGGVVGGASLIGVER